MNAYSAAGSPWFWIGHVPRGRWAIRYFAPAVICGSLAGTPNCWLHSSPTAVIAGVGLAATREVLRRHGGTIEVESSPGSGTSVHVELPVSEDP